MLYMQYYLFIFLKINLFDWERGRENVPENSNKNN